MTILALVNFVAVLGLGGYFFYTQKQHAAAQPKAAEDAKGHGDKKAAAAAHGEEKAEGDEAAEDAHAKPKGEHGGDEEEKEEGGGHGKAAGGHGESGENAAPASNDEDEPSGPLMPLEGMVTNLADPDSDRYLKVSMQARVTSNAAKAEVEANLVPVRNQILLYLSSLTIADTSGAENKRMIQKRVKRIANEAMPTSRITQVYFTEFVIQ